MNGMSINRAGDIRTTGEQSAERIQADGRLQFSEYVGLTPRWTRERNILRRFRRQITLCW